MTEPAGGERRFRRRRFLAGAAAGAATLAMPGWLQPGSGSSVSLAAVARPQKFRKRLPIPAVISDAEIPIEIVQRSIQLLPGRKTKMWTYGGTFPGPTIRRPAGEATTVSFEHRLPANAGKLSVHLHGGHTPAADDGQPGGPAPQQRAFFCDFDAGPPGSGDEELIAPGETRAYTYPGVEDGSDERGAFQWYHDHRCSTAARNIWHGLAGMWITDEPVIEDLLDLPIGARDIPLMIGDRSFNKRNQLLDPFTRPEKPPFDQVTGRHILVNGAIRPFVNVPAQRHRLRLLNASNFRSYNLRFDGGPQMIQIATESGLMPQAVRRNKILIGPGERVEVIVDFAKVRGKRVRLTSAKRGGVVGKKLGSKPYIGDIMEFRVGSATPADETAEVEHLDPLRPLPGWATGALDQTPSHSWTVTVSSGSLKPTWLINGKTFDPDTADETVALGQVVTWRLKNATAVAHLMHLHHTDWYMLKRNGQTPPAHERCLKDTFFLDPYDEVIIAGKMSDYTGKYVVHCHMLDHEDHGLMSQFEVVEP